MSALARPALACVPPFWARGAHLQTIAAQFLASPQVLLPWQARLLDLGDGDHLALRFLEGHTGVSVLLFHGLGGSVDGHYMLRLSALLHARGHAVLAVNHRGAGVGKGLAGKLYHSGSTGDLAAVLALGRELFPGQLQIAVGFSISANMLLLLLGRDGALGLPDRAIAVNPPADLEACSRRLVRGFNRAYDQYFVRRLRREVAGRPGAPALGAARTLRDFDQVYTAPQAGFASRLDYYEQCACGPHLGGIRVPTVILTSVDDPFAPARDVQKWPLPEAVHLHAEATGGHMGYVSGNLPDRRWLDYALDHYLKVLL